MASKRRRDSDDARDVKAPKIIPEQSVHPIVARCGSSTTWSIPATDIADSSDLDNVLLQRIIIRHEGKTLSHWWLIKNECDGQSRDLIAINTSEKRAIQILGLQPRKSDTERDDEDHDEDDNEDNAADCRCHVEEGVRESVNDGVD